MPLKPSMIAIVAAGLLAGPALAQELTADITDALTPDTSIEEVADIVDVTDPVDPVNVLDTSDSTDPTDMTDISDSTDGMDNIDLSDATDPVDDGVLDDVADGGDVMDDGDVLDDGVLDDMTDVDVPDASDLSDVAMSDIVLPSRGMDRGFKPENLPAHSARATGQPAAVAVLTEKFGPDTTRGPMGAVGGAMPPGLTGGMRGGIDMADFGGGAGGGHGMPAHAKGKGPNR